MIARGFLWSVDRLDEKVFKTAPPFDLGTVANIAAAAKTQTQKLAMPTGKGPENLAAGKKASASASQGGHPPEHATDGDLNTRWCGPDGNAGHSWQVDLGKPQEVTGANILWEQEALFQYAVEGSADGKTWVMLSDQTKRDSREPLHQLKFSHKAIQHVRVKTTKVSGSWGSFWECEVLGTKIVDRGVLAAAAKKKAGKKKQVQAAGMSVSVPEGLTATLFSPNTLTPCVASMGVAITGEVYAGVDRIGSLGKGGGKGSIIRLIDNDHDGVHDSHTTYAVIDNPRGIVPVGDKVYVLHGKWNEGKSFDAMNLSVLTDADGNGEADGPPKILVSDISTHKFNESRGIDHSTNGIRMGIDGWIYVAIGDFGFVNATGTDGSKLTMYGGGVIRVRPDGSELETYCHGLRNIYDIAIDPFMNIYTRGNTNDGGGWNMRFIHEIQSGEYGYPKLFKRYTSEIIPALVDIGGGSGTGSIFFDEPGWPKEYNDVPMMCDWGRGALFIHRVTPDGPSFTQEQVEFIKCQRITDVDCDGSGRLFLGSWGASGFSGGTGGYVARVVPEDWQYKAFPDLQKLPLADLAKHLAGPSAKARLHAQQEFLRRGEGMNEIRGVAQDKTASAKGRIAAIFTLKQLLGAKSHADLLGLVNDPAVAEHAIRALADRKSQVDGIPQAPFIQALGSDNPRVRVAAAVALGRLGDKSAATALLSVANPPEVDPLPTPAPPVPADDSDPKSAYESPTLKDAQTHEFDVSIKGWKNLTLTVGDAGNGTGGDHAAWFEPTIIKQDGSTMKLTDLTWQKATQGWGKTAVNASATGAKLARKDGKPMAFGIGTHSVSTISWRGLPKDADRLQVQVGLADTENGGNVRFYIAQKAPRNFGKPKIAEGPHATPNADSIVPHIARQALVALDAGEACVEAIGSNDQAGALMALRYMHSPATVDALIKRFESTTDSDTKQRIARSLVRLVNLEKPYKGDTWWSTRPDTRGPYYYATAWEKTDAIKAALLKGAKSGDSTLAYVISELATKDRAEIEGLPKADAQAVAITAEPTVDLEKIKSQKGQIGKMSLEDILIAVGKVKATPKKGKALFTSQGCFACHALSMDEPQKGPFLGQIGGIMNAEKIAESILRPNSEISQGFKTVQIKTKKGDLHVGFVTERLSDRIQVRNIAGQVTILNPADIAEETLLPTSMMPPGLANGMSIEDFASLVHFLAAKKK
jgi:putative heme-binding domain-containing protein